MLMIGMAIRTNSPTTTNLTRSPQPTEPYAVGKPI